MYRDDQQYCEWIKSAESTNEGLTKFQKFFRRKEEKNRDIMRKEWKIREGKIWMSELGQGELASSDEREANTTRDDALVRHLAAAESAALMKEEKAAKREEKKETKRRRE